MKYVGFKLVRKVSIIGYTIYHFSIKLRKELMIFPGGIKKNKGCSKIKQTIIRIVIFYVVVDDIFSFAIPLPSFLMFIHDFFKDHFEFGKFEKLRFGGNIILSFPQSGTSLLTPESQYFNVIVNISRIRSYPDCYFDILHVIRGKLAERCQKTGERTL